ncbi:MAG: TolC family protein [Brucella intermedia]
MTFKDLEDDCPVRQFCGADKILPWRLSARLLARYLLLGLAGGSLTACNATTKAALDRPLFASKPAVAAGQDGEITRSAPSGEAGSEQLSAASALPTITRYGSARGAKIETNAATYVGATSSRASSDGGASMRGAVLSALYHSAEVRAGESKDSQANVGVSIARQGYFPTLQSSAGSGTNRDYDYSLSLAQPLYDFGQTRARVREAEAGTQVSTQELRGTREDIALRTAKAFISIKRYQDLVDAAHRDVAVHERFVKLASIRSKGGISDATEEQLAHVHLGEAQSSSEDAEGYLRAARSTYFSLVGNQAPALEKVPDLSLQLANNPDLELAASDAPAVKLAQAREEEALSAAKVEKTSLFPKLAVEAYYKNSSDYSTDNKAGIGLRITGPTLTGLSNFQRVEAMQLAADSSRWATQAARRNAALQVREFMDRAPTLRSQISVLGMQKVKAEKLRQLYEDQFKMGERAFLDLLNVQNDVVRIERSIINAGYDIYELQYSAAGALGVLQQQLQIF